MTNTEVAYVVQDARGYGSAVVERLRHALAGKPVVWPDPRHPHILVVESDDEKFYVAPLSAGTVMLLGYWRQ